jgi:hypothetical protein
LTFLFKHQHIFLQASVISGSCHDVVIAGGATGVP